MSCSITELNYRLFIFEERGTLFCVKVWKINLWTVNFIKKQVLCYGLSSLGWNRTARWLCRFVKLKYGVIFILSKILISWTVGDKRNLKVHLFNSKDWYWKKKWGTLFWNVMPCGVVNRYWQFHTTCCLYLQGSSDHLRWHIISQKTTVLIFAAIWISNMKTVMCNIPQVDHIFTPRRC